jgi:uncharacterized protein YciI
VSTIPPIRRETVIKADPDVAFRVFTDRIGTWWPLAEFSVYGPSSTVSFEDREIVELSADGQRAVWGTVTEWQPGRLVAFTWHPGKDAAQASQVTVSFSASDDQTLVTLVHDGWEVFADPAAARAEYDRGWPEVLARFADRAADDAQAAADTDTDTDTDTDAATTWVALMHRPGPNAPTDGSLFSAPGFADHIAFLTRMREAGVLVAAGPLMDATGEGMAVLRLPGGDRLEDARELATRDDLSVANGFFTVDVRPWQVMLEPLP